MNDLTFWRVPEILIWIHTRNYEVVQTLFSGDAECDEEHVALHMARLKIRAPNLECDLPEDSLVVSEEQAKDDLLAKLRCGELGARGVRCDPDNKGNPVSDTAQDIPTYDWAYLRIHTFPRDLGGRYAAFYRDNFFPSWRHIVCLGAAVRELWPVEPGSGMALTNREYVARTYLEGWFMKRKSDYGAWLAAIRQVAKKCNCSEDAAKKSTGKFITAEIERLSKAEKGC